MTAVDERTSRGLCEGCGGRGQIATGVQCPVCQGTGTATAAEAAEWRGQLVDGALEVMRRQLVASGAAATGGWVREHAQSAQDARQAALRATQAAEQARAHAQAPLEEAQAVLAQAKAVLARAEAIAASAAPAPLPPGAPGFIPPDPTDPPPGAPIPPGFGAGDVFYMDSLLIRQLDVWGGFNAAGGTGGLLTNPMTTTGDLITGLAAGAPARLGIGAAGQVLTVSGGVPVWANNPAGFANPMTTAGDLITGAAAGAAQRLAVGANGQVLTVVAGAPAWAASAAGFANPMTTAGDLITGGVAGAAGRLGIGAAGQVLTVSGGGAPVWANNPAGFANPMTTPGDLIVGGTAGLATRLARGATNGYALQVLNGAVAWGQPLGLPLGGPSSTQPTIFQQADGSMLVLPQSIYSLAGDDAQYINAAFGFLPTMTDPEVGQVYTVGTVRLAAGAYTIQGQITKPPMANLWGQGPATRLNVSGAAITGIYSHFPAPGGAGHSTKGGTIRDLLVDGTATTGASTGIDIGDGWGHSIHRVWIQNFITAGAIGLSVCNRQTFTEKFTATEVSLINNTTGAQHWTVVSASSQEYQHVQYYIWATNNTNGVTFQGVNWNGRFELEGNIGQDTNPNTNWMIGFLSDVAGNGGGPTTFKGHMCANWEINPMGLPGGSPPPYTLYFGPAVTGGASTFQGSGFIRRSGSATPVTNAVAGQIQFRGLIIDASGTPQAVFDPAFVAGQPNSGTVYTNTGNDALVAVTGGTVTSITVQGKLTGQTTGQLFVPAGGTIQVVWTVQPTWSWVNAL